MITTRTPAEIVDGVIRETQAQFKSTDKRAIFFLPSTEGITINLLKKALEEKLPQVNLEFFEVITAKDMLDHGLHFPEPETPLATFRLTWE